MRASSQRRREVPYGISRAIATLVLCWLVFPGSIEAAEFEVNVLNDISSMNGRKDDLYTSDLSFAFSTDSHRFAFEERTFTNREEQIRFDETYLTLGLPLQSFSGWLARPELGVLHVGRGVFGESAQNAVHRALGESPVDIPYPEQNHVYATATIHASRQFGIETAFPIRLEAAATTAPGFRSTVAFQFGIDRELPGGVAVRFGAGIRADEVSSQLLKDVIDSAGPTAALVLAWREIELGITKNRYGTGAIHATVGFRVGLPSRANRD